jgi:hypothetical protein
LGYNDLTDEDKLEEAIKFVATGHPLPVALVEFLKAEGLYDLVVNPQEN